MIKLPVETLPSDDDGCLLVRLRRRDNPCGERLGKRSWSIAELMSRQRKSLRASKTKATGWDLSHLAKRRTTVSRGFVSGRRLFAVVADVLEELLAMLSFNQYPRNRIKRRAQGVRRVGHKVYSVTKDVLYPASSPEQQFKGGLFLVVPFKSMPRPRIASAIGPGQGVRWSAMPGHLGYCRDPPDKSWPNCGGNWAALPR